jgi:hypothetical protein
VERYTDTRYLAVADFAHQVVASVSRCNTAYGHNFIRELFGLASRSPIVREHGTFAKPLIHSGIFSSKLFLLLPLSLRYRSRTDSYISPV